MLDKIIAYKLEQLKIRKAKVSYQSLEKSIASLREPCKDFHSALRQESRVALIGEVKKASPSKGIIRKDFNPVEIAKIYTEAGVDAISVLTEDKFFMGSLDNLRNIRQVTELPLLRKDFIVDPYQILEARAAGADAILLIARILKKSQLDNFLRLAQNLALSTLVEVHTEKELQEVLELPVKIVGINNRNLENFETELETTFKLKRLITDKNITVISESGIRSFADVVRLQENKVNAMLVGETLMRNPDIKQAISSLTGRRLA